MPDQPTDGFQRLEVAIEKMVYGGEGLARTPEGVVLVPGLLPGERAVVDVETPRRGVRRGNVIEVKLASPQRVSAECPYFGRCGGCQHQQISYETQLQLKQEILREGLQRVGRLQPEQLPAQIEAIGSEPWQYRNRIRLRVVKTATSSEVGYMEGSSHTLCAVDCCPISSPALQQLLRGPARDSWLNLLPEGACELELFVSDSDRQLMATIYSAEGAPPNFTGELGERLRAALPQCSSVCWVQERTGAQAVSGGGALTYRVGEFHYRVSHGSFFQVNRFLVSKLVTAVLDQSSGARALDLYAGVGFLTLPLARHFEAVTAVESHAPAARDLASNTGVAGTRIRTHSELSETFLARTSHRWELIVADPPRAGMSKPVREHLIRLRPQRLVYVSCDPTTLARDLGTLIPAGYRLSSLCLLDQFPQTFHIETVAHLERI